MNISTVKYGLFAVCASMLVFTSCSKKENPVPVAPSEPAPVESVPVEPAKPQYKLGNGVVVYDECGIYTEKDGKMVYRDSLYAGYTVDAVIGDDGNMESKDAVRDYDGQTRTFCRFIKDGESYWIQDAFIVLADYPAIVTSTAVLYSDMTIESMKSTAIDPGTIVAISRADDPHYVAVSYYSNGLRTGNFIKSDRVAYDDENRAVEVALINKRIEKITKDMEASDSKETILKELSDNALRLEIGE